MSYLLRIKLPVICLVLFLLLSMSRYTAILAEEGTMRLLDSAAGKTFFDRLRNVQEDIRTLQARFVEERSVASLKAPLHFEGKIYYNSEGMFFMEYNKPINYIIRVKGKEALFYVKGSQTVDVVDVSGVKGVATHSGLFGMKLNRFKGQVWEGEQRYRLEERAQEDAGDSGGQHLTVFLNRKTLLVERVRIEDEYGEVTEITLSDMQVNRELPASVLQFTLPPGIKRNRLDNP